MSVEHLSTTDGNDELLQGIEGQKAIVDPEINQGMGDQRGNSHISEETWDELRGEVHKTGY